MLKKLFFYLSPFIVFRIKGSSMEPILHEGQKIIVGKKWFFPPQIGSIIALLHPNTHRYLVKRITKQTKTHVWVEGTNHADSTDSRDLGWIEKKSIIGTVISPKS